MIKILFALVFIILIGGKPATAVEQPPKEEITIAAVGDLMLGGRAEPYLNEYGPDYPFTEVMPSLRRADISVGNLESPISIRGNAVADKKFTLRAGPIAARALKQAGIRVVTLANNHSMDFGPLALKDTQEALDEYGILYSGAGVDLDAARTPALVKVKGKTLAFLSYSLTFPLEFYASAGKPGTAPGFADFVKADIEKVRPRADLVIVSFHWGAELLTAAKDYQLELGHQAIDWGADLVLGHHPHVLQEIEIYKGRLIAYSLGNFVFGSESNRTNSSMILLLTFQDKTLVRVEAVPLDVNNYRVKYRPHVLTGTAAAEVLSSINTASARFNTRLDIAHERGTIVLAPVEKSAGTVPPSTSPLPNVSGPHSPAEVSVLGPDNSPRTSFANGVH